MRFFWGLLLIFLGFLLVFDNLGLLGGLNLWDIFWPGLIIMLGVRQLVRGFSRPARRPNHPQRQRQPQKQVIDIPLDHAGKARLQLDTPPGRLLLNSGAPEGVLLHGHLTGRADVATSMAGSTLSVHLKLVGDQPEEGEWVVDLSEIPTLTLALTGDAGPAHLDLRSLSLHLLRLYLPNDTLVQLPAGAGAINGGDTDIYLSGSGRYHLFAPAGTAARIMVDNPNLELDLDADAFPPLAPADDEAGTTLVYQTPGFDDAPARLRITVEPPVTALSLTANGH